MHRANLCGIGDGDGRSEHPGLRDPMNAGHLAVAVEGVGCAKGMVVPDCAFTRQDDGHARASDSRRIVNQRGVTNEHARHIGNGVVFSSEANVRWRCPNLAIAFAWFHRHLEHRVIKCQALHPLPPRNILARPPMNASRTPSSRPHRTTIAAANKASPIAARPSSRIRVKRSRPKESAPNGCSREGDASRCLPSISP